MENTSWLPGAWYGNDILLVLLFYNLVILIDISIFSSMVAFVTVKLDLKMIFMKIFRMPVTYFTKEFLKALMKGVSSDPLKKHNCYHFSILCNFI